MVENTLKNGQYIISHILNKYIGLKEQPGIKKSSNVILTWIKKYFPFTKDDGDVAWCSIGLKEVCHEIGFDFTNVTPLAITWQTVGQPVLLKDAIMGNIVVVKRSGGHHVGVLVRVSEYYGQVFLLGFNQSNKCSIEPYPLKDIVFIRSIDFINIKKT